MIFYSTINVCQLKLLVRFALILEVMEKWSFKQTETELVFHPVFKTR